MLPNIYENLYTFNMGFQKLNLLFLSVLIASTLNAQIIWNREEDDDDNERNIDALEFIVKTVLGKNYVLIEKKDQEQLILFIKEKNAQLSTDSNSLDGQTFNLDFPNWIKQKYKTKFKFPESAAVDIKKEVQQSKPKLAFWKRLNPQMGIGMSNAYTGEKSGGRKAETVQSDSLQLNLRGAYHRNGAFRFSLYPDIAVALNSSRQSSSYDLDVSTIGSWDIENRFFTSPVFGMRFSSSSHVYVNTAMAYVVSNDTRYQLMTGGLTQWDFLERKWATHLLLNYTPLFSMTRTSNTGGKLTGFGYEASLTTEFFKRFYLTLALSYSGIRNSQIELEKYRVNTLIFYPF